MGLLLLMKLLNKKIIQRTDGVFECGYEVTLKDVRASIVRTVANYANI